jgi:RNA-dependent RNA polymerase
MFLEEDFNRPLTGRPWLDNKGFRRRVGALDESHRQVAPYAHQLRLILSSSEEIEEFQDMCRIASLRKPIKAPLVAESKTFFQRTRARKQLDKIHTWLKTLPWAVAFQIEAILHNGLLNTDDLLQGLYGDIMDLYKTHPHETSTVLRLFILALPSAQTETPRQCFQNVKQKRLRWLSVRRPSPTPKDDEIPFMCHHTTFTPTKILLDGPYPTQSNRIIRQFRDFSDHFMRVDFRDEGAHCFHHLHIMTSVSIIIQIVHNTNGIVT